MSFVACLFLAELETGEASHLDILAGFANRFINELPHTLVRVLYIRLEQKYGFAWQARVILGQLVLAYHLRICRDDLHSDVVGEVLELFRPGDEICLAVDFDHSADTTGVDVAFDEALSSLPACFLGSRS